MIKRVGQYIYLCMPAKVKRKMKRNIFGFLFYFFLKPHNGELIDRLISIKGTYIMQDASGAKRWRKKHSSKCVSSQRGWEGECRTR